MTKQTYYVNLCDLDYLVIFFFITLLVKKSRYDFVLKMEI